MHVPDLIVLIQSPCVFTLGEMPFPVGTGARELALLRHLEHREPIARGIVRRRGARVRRGDRREVERLAAGRFRLRRIDEPVAAHPHAVARLGEIGNQVATLIVGHDDAHELRRQIVRLGDHPDARLGSARAGDDAPDIVLTDVDSCRGSGQGSGKDHDTGNQNSADAHDVLRLHASPSLG